MTVAIAASIATGVGIGVYIGVSIRFLTCSFDRARACADGMCYGGAGEVQRQLVRGEEGQEDLCRLRLEESV